MMSQQNPGAQAARPRPRRAAGWGCALLAVVCYLNTLPNDYCYDDVPIVRDSPLVQAPGMWTAIWTTDYWSPARFGAQRRPSADADADADNDGWPNKDLLYRPFAVSTYRLVRQLIGPAPWPQHLANVLLHALATGMLVAAARRLGLSPIAGACAGALFAVLPIHNEAVASVVGRADLLVAVGVLGVMLAHGRGLGTSGAWRQAGWFALAGAASFAAMTSKESGVVVVPIVILWAMVDVLRRSRHEIGTVGQPSRPTPGDGMRIGTAPADDGFPAGAPASPWRRFVLPVGRASYLVVPVAAYLALRHNALGGQLLHQPTLTKTVNVLVDAPAWQHALGVVQAWGMYWSKTVFPWVLSIGYSINSIRLATTPADAHVLAGTFAAVGLIAVAVWAGRRSLWAVVFLVIALAISHAPTSNAMTLIQVFFAERLWYLPSVWAALLMGWLVAQAWRRPGVRLFFAVACIAFLARTIARNAEWRDNGTLFAAAYRDQPNGVQPLYLYGRWLVGDGRIDEGVGLLERAVAIDVGYTDAHRALGTAHLRAGRLREALHHLQTAEMQAPGHRSTAEALARVQAVLAGSATDEVSALKAAAARRPDDEAAHLAVVAKLREFARLREALDWLAAHDDRFAQSARWQWEYATTLVLANRLDEAISRYERGLAIEPNDPQRLVELAMLLLERRKDGDVSRADALSERAVALAPNAPAALAGRAETLAVQGKIQAAQQAYRRAIENLAPGSPQRRMYAERLRTLGG